MRKLFFFLAALLPLLAPSCQPGKVDPLPVMSFNVRYGTAKDGDHVWENRKDAACAMILDQRPAVFGVQEALDFQLTYPTATTEEMDSYWDLPFTKLPHPRYKGKRIPAYDMIKFSVCTHRGCFGGCNFCTIAAHQGKFISSRSEASILKEVRALNNLPDFAGNISDVGAPTANMYGMHGKNQEICAKCKRRSCLFPARCPNLDCDHTRLLDLYHRIDSTKGIRHSYIGSGIRYDLFLTEDGFVDESSKPYLKERACAFPTSRFPTSFRFPAMWSSAPSSRSRSGTRPAATTWTCSRPGRPSSCTASSR